ncbi:MAG: polysaccharide deacetylase family protein [Bacillota bacterium]
MAGAAIVLGLLGWVYLWPWPRYVPILTYHSVLPRAEMDRSNAVLMSAERFAQQMAFLKRHGYHPVTLEAVNAFVAGQGGELPPKPIVISFDDGYEDNYVHVRPVLRETGFTAVVNVVVRFTDEASAGRTVDPALRYMTWEQLRAMTADGTFEVESHSYDSHHDVAIDGLGTAAPALTHRRFLWDMARLETEAEYRTRILADLTRSRADIATQLGRTPLAITYPYGTSNPTVEALARQAGYGLGLSTLKGFNLPGENPMRLRRITIVEADGPLRFAFKLSPAHYPVNLLLSFLHRQGVLKGD